MSKLNEIVDIINTIEGSTKPFKLKISAWPYSRSIIKAIAENNMIKLEIKRLSKDHEEFTIYANPEDEAKIKKIISLVNKEAKESGNKVTSERNVVADKLRKKLGLKEEVKEAKPVKEKAVKAPKEKAAKPEAKKPALKAVAKAAKPAAKSTQAKPAVKSSAKPAVKSTAKKAVPAKKSASL